MGDLKVKFLEKDYLIPEDVLVYIDLLTFTDNVQVQLFNAFTRELKKHETGCIDDKDLANEINRQVGRFIAKLCDYGIFNRTVNDYIRDNKGYQLFFDVNKAALNKMKDILLRKLDTLKDGFEEALYKKESSVTGMGFSIWSGSFINHALYAAMQASTLNKQEKAAAKQYEKDMDELHQRMENQYGSEQSEYINNTYIPHMEIALTAFAYELLDRFIADLIANKKFDSRALDFVDLSRSNDLLDNMSLSSNKTEILENAFIVCPYNTAVYIQAIRLELLDYDSFQAAKTFQQSEKIISFLKESWGQISYPDIFNINYYYVKLWALFTDKNEEALLRSISEKYVFGVIKAYAKIKGMSLDESLCMKIMREFDDSTLAYGESISKSKAQAYVCSIVKDSVWNQLINDCGHSDMIDRLKKNLPEEVIIESKEDIDGYILDILTAKFEEVRIKLIAQIEAKKAAEKAEKERKAEEERKRAEEKAEKIAKIKSKTKKGVKILVGVIVALIAVFILYRVWIEIKWNIIVPSQKYEEAVQLMQQGEYQEAYDIFSWYDEYKDSAELAEECKAYIDENNYNQAISLMNEGRHEEALTILLLLGEAYKDCPALIEECYTHIDEDRYAQAIALMAENKYSEALSILTLLDENYRDCKELIAACHDGELNLEYMDALQFIEDGNFEEARKILLSLGNYKDCMNILQNFSVVYQKEYIENYVGEREGTYIYTYDSLGRLLAKDYKNGVMVYEYTYEDNKLISMVLTMDSGKTSSTDYYYNNMGVLTQTVSISIHGELTTTEYYYNDGLLTKTVATDDDGSYEITTFLYDTKGQLIKEHSQSVNEYHPEGYPYETIIEYSYDDTGHMLTETWTFDDGDVSVTEYVYDEYGCLVKEIRSDGDDIIEYKYDANHFLISKSDISDGEVDEVTEYSNHLVFYTPSENK